MGEGEEGKKIKSLDLARLWVLIWILTSESKYTKRYRYETLIYQILWYYDHYYVPWENLRVPNFAYFEPYNCGLRPQLMEICQFFFHCNEASRAVQHYKNQNSKSVTSQKSINPLESPVKRGSVVSSNYHTICILG